MRRSLTLKWSLTLLLTSLTGVVLVGLFAFRATRTEFDRLRIEQVESSFISDLTRYYQEHESWEGVEAWLVESTMRLGRPPEIIPFQPFTLVGLDGNVLLGTGPFQAGQPVNADAFKRSVPIVVEGQTVGNVMVGLDAPILDPREQLYLDRTNQALFIGAVGAGGISLLIGFLLSRQFLRPLSDLQRAIAAMRQGDLNQQVPVTTRDELGDLATAFNRMSAEVHRANQLRRQMTADVAHDLRTPLMVIVGYLEALSDGTLAATPARYEAMFREAQLLQRLIEDLRTLSLADAGELKLIYQRVKPDDLLYQVRESFEHLAEQRQIQLDVQTDSTLPDVSIDRERMVQVLANLVSNAMRYTPEGGSVTLAAQREQDALKLTVRDTGSGIPAEKLPNIFERFYRVDEARHDGESGLGLAIARMIVEAHGGSITAASEVNRGTTMFIRLPVG